MMEFAVARRGFGQHILVKNFIQFSLAVVVYWLIGYAFSFGEPDSEFIGEKYFGGKSWLTNEDIHGLCYSYNLLVGIFIIFIVNLALVEKVSYITYVVYPICLLIWIWPVVVAWIWGGGWLHDASEDLKEQMIDYGGSVTVFTFAGAFALVGAIFSGRREGRFKDPANYKITHGEIYVLGAFLTILGVLGIGSAQQPDHGLISHANLWISGGVCSLISLKLLTFYDKDLSDHYIAIYQGFIAGMVFVASSAGNSRPWVVGLHGLIAGPVFALGVKFVKWVKLDDAANVTATFLIPGIFGGILPGFIHNDLGVYYDGWESGQMLGTNVVGTIVVLLWSLFWAVIVFGALALLKVLKLDIEDSLEGAVITQRGFSKGHTDVSKS